ncbi:MAG: hypothetical protein R2748_34205 [Bryobacterales bacterium]
MGVVDFEFGSLIQGRQNEMGTFDADLNPDGRNATTNADLTLYIRVNFQKIEPTATVTTYNDADGTAVPIQSWGASEWSGWKRRFVTDCQRRWNGKFWLRTPTTYSRLNWPESSPTHRCNLYCRFEISEQSNADGAHAVIPVVKVSRRNFFRSHMLLYSSNDLRMERLTRGSNFFTHVHEIGHLIGLDHPGTGLPGCVDGDESACYAAADGDDRGTMGRGSQPRPTHAEPWRKAAATLTGIAKTQWTVSMSRVYPVRL